MASFHIKYACSTDNQHFLWNIPFLKKKSNYPNFWLSEWGPIIIESDNWSSTVPTFNKFSVRATQKKFKKYVIVRILRGLKNKENY